MNSKKNIIAIQGSRASFHEIAAEQYFGSSAIETLHCATFQEVCAALENGIADYAVMAIENLASGSLLTNYALLLRHEFHVVGEHTLPISQHLMAIPGQSLADINIVRSHPVAILQCSDFLAGQQHLQAVDDFDTAGCAEQISLNGQKGVAAIAGSAAASAFGLEILASDIQNLKNNHTRFLVLSRSETSVSDANKAIIQVTVDDEPGALVRVLQGLGQVGINLTRIQHVPFQREDGKSAIVIEMEWQVPNDVDRLIKPLLPGSTEIKILGSYAK